MVASEASPATITLAQFQETCPRKLKAAMWPLALIGALNRFAEKIGGGAKKGLQVHLSPAFGSGQVQLSARRFAETGSLRPASTASSQVNLDRDETGAGLPLVSGGLPESVQHETRGTCAPRRIIGPGLVSRFPGGAVAPAASQWVFRLRYSGHRWPFGPITFSASAERGSGSVEGLGALPWARAPSSSRSWTSWPTPTSRPPALVVSRAP